MALNILSFVHLEDNSTDHFNILYYVFFFLPDFKFLKSKDYALSNFCLFVHFLSNSTICFLI